MKPGALSIVIVGVALMLTSCGGGDDAEIPVDPRSMTLRLSSPAFEAGGTIPRHFTCEGKDVSPPLAWSGVPETARSLAFLCDDPDAPGGTWSHWVLFDLPAEASGLPEGLAPEETVRVASNGAEYVARQGRNDFDKLGYGGPCPPAGSPHRYFFRLFALDTTLDLDPGATRPQVLRTMKGHVQAWGQLTGRSAR